MIRIIALLLALCTQTNAPAPEVELPPRTPAYAYTTNSDHTTTPETQSTETTDTADNEPVRDTAMTAVPLLSTSPCKTYMDYRAITNTASPQWEYIHNSGEININDSGYLTTSDGYTGIALGSYFGGIGSKYVFRFSGGRELRAVKVEEKADADMNADGFSHPLENHVIEFVIDTERMEQNRQDNGLIWWGNFNNCPDWQGDIIEIWRID